MAKVLKFYIRKSDEVQWSTSLGRDIYEAAENFCCDSNLSGVFEVKDFDGTDEKIYKVQVETQTTYDAYDYHE